MSSAPILLGRIVEGVEQAAKRPEQNRHIIQLINQSRDYARRTPAFTLALACPIHGPPWMICSLAIFPSTLLSLALCDGLGTRKIIDAAALIADQNCVSEAFLEASLVLQLLSSDFVCSLQSTF